ncbi:MAG: hypothetical protein KJ901_18840, partial [Gammaproteobacteria bacterium]|nr:hypothetical protein [Gammaproteobacteria bacterium]
RASPETEAVDARGATRASSERVRPTRREARRPPPPVAVAAADAPARNVDPTPPVQAPRAPAAADTTPNATPCTEILLRASLGPLKAADAALLKKGCE